MRDLYERTIPAVPARDARALLDDPRSGGPRAGRPACPSRPVYGLEPASRPASRYHAVRVKGNQQTPPALPLAGNAQLGETDRKVPTAQACSLSQFLKSSVK